MSSRLLLCTVRAVQRIEVQNDEDNAYDENDDDNDDDRSQMAAVPHVACRRPPRAEGWRSWAAGVLVVNLRGSLREFFIYLCLLRGGRESRVMILSCSSIS